MDKLIKALTQLAGEMLSPSPQWDEVIVKAQAQNPWFTVDHTRLMLHSIARDYLNPDDLSTWLIKYPPVPNAREVALIMAGNIPLAGFHDVLCVLLAGNNALIKASSQDTVLLPYIIERLAVYLPEINERIRFVEKVTNPDAIIATGSNNSSRYFEYYFGKYPHIIRKNRNSLAIITGNETDEQLRMLSDDIFLYFGLGCRNVSLLLLPQGFNLDRIFTATDNYVHFLNHNKYKNNLDYHVALFLLQKVPFLTNNLFILKEGSALATPVSVVNYRYYQSLDEVNHYVLENSANIQCLVSDTDLSGFETTAFGQSQHPRLNDFADNINTMRFLTGL